MKRHVIASSYFLSVYVTRWYRAAYMDTRILRELVDWKGYRWRFPLHDMSRSRHRSFPASQHRAAPVSCAGCPLSAARSSPQPQAPGTRCGTNKAPDDSLSSWEGPRSQGTCAFSLWTWKVIRTAVCFAEHRLTETLPWTSSMSWTNILNGNTENKATLKQSE